MRISQVLLLTGVISFSATSPARAQDKPTVGIAVGVKVNVTDIEARLISDELGKALREKFEIDVIAGEDAEKRLPEGGLPETCIAETECLRSTAEALGVKTLLVLVAVRVGDSVQVDATLFDVETGNSSTRPPVRMTARERQWRDAFAASATDMLPGAPPRPESATPPPQVEPDPVQPDPPPPGPAVKTRSSGPGFLARRTTLSWVLGGLTVAAVGVGTGFGLRALSLDNREPSRCPKDDQCTAAKVSTGSFVAAGLLGAGFIYTFFFTEKPMPAGEGAISIGAGPGDLGLAVGGRF